MGLISNLRSSLRADGFVSPLPPDADFWYARPGVPSSSGMLVSPESAMQLSAVFACVRVCAETIASLPLIIYRRRPDGGKERATDHPLYKVLHDKPNEWQTSFEFVEMMQCHLELRGNAFAHIVPGPGGAVDQLVPIHPDRVQVYRLPNGHLRYEVRAWYDGSIQNYADVEIFHMRGLSFDGLVGLSTIAVQREMLGTSLAQMEYSGRFFANDSQAGGVLETEQELSEKARATLKAGWQESRTGMNRHRIAVLEQGLKFNSISLTNKDSQFLEMQQFSRGQIASLFRVPPHKIGDLTKATFSNIEQQSIEFVTDCTRPRCVRWERRIQNELLDPLGLEGDYFAEFLMDALLRGDLKSRYDSYNIGRTAGFLSPNDICEMENRNPIPPEKGGDDYLRPLNMVVPADPPDADPNDPNDPQDDDPPDDPEQNQEDATAVNARLREFALSAAERVVRKEVTALRKLSGRLNGDNSLFSIYAAEFYATHAKLVSETMGIPIEEAEGYVARNQTSVQFDRAAIERIEEKSPDELATLALQRRKP